MRIVETPAFTRRVTELLSDEEYRTVQEALTARPTLGALIVGAGGARKVRLARAGGGKSGGARMIYYYASADGIIYMLLLYAKNERESLTQAQKNVLKKVIAGLE